MRHNNLKASVAKPPWATCTRICDEVAGTVVYERPAAMVVREEDPRRSLIDVKLIAADRVEVVDGGFQIARDTPTVHVGGLGIFTLDQANALASALTELTGLAVRGDANDEVPPGTRAVVRDGAQ